MYFKQFIRLFVRATYLLFGEPATVDKNLSAAASVRSQCSTLLETRAPVLRR